MRKLQDWSVCKQPTWQIFLLHTITFGLYDIYWFYRNWKQIYKHNNIKKEAGLNTLGLLVPFLSIFLVYKQFSDIKKFTEKEGTIFYSTPGRLTLGYFALSLGYFALSWVATSFLYPKNFIFVIPIISFPNFIFVIPIISFPLLFMQDTLNGYWEKVTNNPCYKARMTWIETIICCIFTPVFVYLFIKALLLYYRFL